MNLNKSIDDLKHSINILEANIRLFQEGNTSVYRVIAGQLRLLLCDGKSSLVPRLHPNAKLHPLKGYITKKEDEEWKMKFGHSINEGLVFQMPGRVKFNGKGGKTIEILFDELKQVINLEEWLEQILFNIKITIRQLIRSVADKESVHSDKNYDETLKFTRSIKLVDENIHVRFIVAIGEYILKFLKTIPQK